MANKRNYIVLDTETTGLSPIEGHEIVQIAAKAINHFDFSDNHAGTLNLLIKPQRPEKASAKAIEVIGPIWPAAQKDGLHPKAVLQRLYDWIKVVDGGTNVMTKPIVVGYNIRFDLAFLEAGMLEYKIVESLDDLPWSRQSLDVQDIALFLFESDPSMINFKLDSFLSKLGMERNTAKHDALEDVELTAQAFVRSMKFFRLCRSKLKVTTCQPVSEVEVKTSSKAK